MDINSIASLVCMGSPFFYDGEIPAVVRKRIVQIKAGTAGVTNHKENLPETIFLFIPTLTVTLITETKSKHDLERDNKSAGRQ